MGLLRNVFYGIEVAALLVIVCLSLTVAIVMGLLKGDYKGDCPLYATTSKKYIRFHDVSNCDFVIGMHSFAIFIAVFAGVYRLMEIIKQKKMITSAYFPIFFGVLYLLLAFFIMVTACIVTVGFNKLCKELQGSSRDSPECIHFQQFPPKDLSYDPSHFHDYLVAAETTAWLSFGFWLCLSGLTAFLNVYCKNKM